MASELNENGKTMPDRPEFAVVGIGASAGGIEALLRLFKSVPPAPGVAFVVVLHLSPEYTSHAKEVIQSVTDLRVSQVAETVPLEINCIYVIPPGKLLSMFDGHLRLSEPDLPRHPPTSIDVFFRSLADVHGARAVSIVLSGTGSDGSVGLSRVRERGGITVAQRPEDAEYSDMPRHAIATGDVDLILRVDVMIAKLLPLIHNATQIDLPTPSDEESDGGAEQVLAQSEPLDAVLETLRQRTHHDFSNYKRGTILRRIERRMQVNGLTTLAQYRDFVVTKPEETPLLLADMLIGVTNFFRDPEAFVALEGILRSSLAKNVDGQEEIRAWVPACSTGEEAYSVAIILSEISGTLRSRPRVSVYATDIDAQAIARARTGNYSGAIANDITPARLSRYFIEEGGRYKVVKSLRDLVIFAPHNVLRDPPFSRLDLVSCRNLLIYLDRRAQNAVLQTLHYALRSSGHLFLGNAESADFAIEGFTAVNSHQKIYRVIPGAARGDGSTLPFLPGSHPFAGHTFFSPTGNTLPLESAAPYHGQALDVFGPPVLILRASGDIVHRSATAISLTQDMRQTRVHNLFDIVQAEAHPTLLAIMERCLHQTRREEALGVPFETASGVIPVDLSLRPYRDPTHEEHLLWVVCDALDTAETTASSHSVPNETVGSLRNALAKSEDRLRGTMRHAQSSTEELRASNEELQAMNEELRSASEELEASREELQSLNEELVTVNAELLTKVQESARVSDDLRNLISLVGVATIFVDKNFSIKRYTSPAETLFNILPGDQGRPLQHLTHRLDYPQMLDDLRHAFEDLKTTEREVAGKDGRAFLARVLPYRTDDNRIDGAVLALIDVTDQKSAQEQARASLEKLKLAAYATHDFAIIVLDQDGNIVSWNVGASRIFGYYEWEMLGGPIDRLFTAEDIAHDKVNQERKTATQTGRAEDERWHVSKSNNRVYCSGYMSRIDVPGFSGFAKIVHDATERKVADFAQENSLAQERALSTDVKEKSRMKDEFIAVLSHELKNPLNLINMKAEMLVRHPQSRHITPIQHIADAIQNSVKAQAQLIDDLLDFSRANTGKLSLNFAIVDISAIVREICETIEKDAAASNIALAVSLPENLVAIRGDAVRIEQIIWNLVTNALKFTPNGGAVNVQMSIEANMARLEITDTGIGISPEAIRAIFDMFNQAPALIHQPRKGGLGIGLSLVRQLTELHGGTVEATSPGLGQGSTFVVRLPTEISLNSPEASRRPVDLSVFYGLKILLVEDNPASLAAMSELLSLYKADVMTATTANEAAKSAATTRFDVVITDINQPDLDGYWLVSTLRAMPQYTAIPIIAITGLPLAQEKRRATASGCDACLAKPFALELIAEIVTRKQKNEEMGN